MRGRDSQGVYLLYTLLYLKWITNKDLPYKHIELCSVLCASLDGREVWGRMDTGVCMAETLCCLPETITALLIGYTSIQNIKVLKKNFFFKRMAGLSSRSVPGLGRLVPPASSPMANLVSWYPLLDSPVLLKLWIQFYIICLPLASGSP